jgi:enediyne biosynthesis protein E4
MRHFASCVQAAAPLLLTAYGLAAAGLVWSEGPGFRAATLPRQEAGRTGFASMSPDQTGVRFTNELRGDVALTNAVAHNGSGVAVGDVDGDGWPDLYFAGLEGPNRFFRNLGGWRFEERPLGEAACPAQLSTAAALVDLDGDGDLDLLVNGIAVGTRLFLNDGRGGFAEHPDPGLSRTASATSLALADIDGDGDLDLYCTHYIDVMHLADPTTRFAIAREDGQWRITRVNSEPASKPYWRDRFELLPGGRVRELPESDGFYRNDGGGQFTPIGSLPGTFRSATGEPLGPFRDWGLAVMFRDLNGDGAPDFFVCNDNASPDRLWLNDGLGTFHAPQPWVFRHTSRSSMSLDFADVDRDGHDDLLVLDMLARSPQRRMRQLVRDPPDLAANDHVDAAPRYNRNMLFLGRPDGTFAEAALRAGLAASDWSWCPIFLDVDLDGYEDLLVANGFDYDVMDQDSHDAIRSMKLTPAQRIRFRQFHPPWLTANAAFRNRRDGTFEEAGDTWGFNRAGVSHGMAVGDFDQDGDLDVVVNNLNGVASLYQNLSSAGRIAVRLAGLPPNTAGIGARIRLTGGAVSQSQEMIAAGRYLSSDQALRVFAADPASAQPLQLEVQWRNGHRTILPVRPNTLYEIIQPEAGPARATHSSPAESSSPWFTDVSTLLDHRHVEDAFDDWARQPLLPRRLSRLGPGLSWYDVDRDGWEDLIVSAAQGGRLALFLNEQGRSFRRLETGAATGDQVAVLGWPDGRGTHHLLVAQSHPTSEPATWDLLTAYRLTNLASASTLDPAWTARGDDVCPGPLALGDLDGDGDLDLFVGGRFRSGRYPEPVPSSLWLNEGGQLRRLDAPSHPLAAAGLVSGATWADLDGDGYPDLILAVEWGPLRIFRNRQGQLEEVTEAWGFATKTGWWTSVTAGDFDGDGRLDLAAGNWGRNSIYELDRPAALRLYYGDADGDGTLEILEARPDGDQWFPIRPRPWVARGLPDLPQRILTHEAYGQATVQEIWPGPFSQVQYVEATFLESAVFLNRGDRFECVPLPPAAQLAPVFSLGTGDFDGDGLEDLFASQNFFGGGSDLTRDDAGRGQWLRGRGDGTFEPVETGIILPGEQRAAALADFDQDGRIDLAVTQNNGPTRLYRNARARRGLRVILEGPPGNPTAVGAQLRLQYPSGRLGPVRSVQAGSGYRAQDGSVQVLGLADRPDALRVRWPGGKEQTVPLNDEAWEIRVKFGG